MFKTIEDLKRHQFVGNHASDHAAFSAIDARVLGNEWSVADKAEALRQMADRGMGCGRDEHVTDERLVADYYHDCGLTYTYVREDLK